MSKRFAFHLLVMRLKVGFARKRTYVRRKRVRVRRQSAVRGNYLKAESGMLMDDYY